MKMWEPSFKKKRKSAITFSSLFESLLWLVILIYLIYYLTEFAFAQEDICWVNADPSQAHHDPTLQFCLCTLWGTLVTLRLRCTRDPKEKGENLPPPDKPLAVPAWVRTAAGMSYPKVSLALSNPSWAHRHVPWITGHEPTCYSLPPMPLSPSTRGSPRCRKEWWRAGEGQGGQGRLCG